MKVLVIQIKMIGDVLASTVICEAIKKIHPESEIHYLIQKNTFPVVDNNPFIDRVLFFDSSKHKGLSGLIQYGKDLKKENYDCIIDAYGKWESILPTYFSGSKIRVGVKKWYTPFFYTQTVTRCETGNGIAIRFRLLLASKALNCEISQEILPKIHLKPEEINQAQQSIASHLDASQPIYMISVLGSSLNKSLPYEYMANTLDLIASTTKAQLVFNYMPQQQDQANRIYNLCKQETKSNIIINFYIKGLRDFISVLSQCDALIGNEGGAVNMAKALQIPTFTIFSPWINRNSWNIMEETGLHDTIHLIDFFPELYKNKHPKKFKKVALNYYQKLNSQLFDSKLQDFLKRVGS